MSRTIRSAQVMATDTTESWEAKVRRIRRLLAAARKRRQGLERRIVPQPAPRYDEVFFSAPAE